jgi:hypothetical protein
LALATIEGGGAETGVRANTLLVTPKAIRVLTDINGLERGYLTDNQGSLLYGHSYLMINTDYNDSTKAKGPLRGLS